MARPSHFTDGRWRSGRGDGSGPCSSCALRVLGKSESGDSRKALGPEHPTVATALENYADLLRKTDRESEAAKLEARAKAIRAKHAQENPPKNPKQ